jgi:hypothetical protein
MQTALILIGVLGGLVLLIWLGLRIKPACLPAFPQPSGEQRLVHLPRDLPAPARGSITVGSTIASRSGRAHS